MTDLKIYKDAKEIPFLIYKKIKQTGDFFYMVKGYQEGDNIEADKEELKEKFDSLLQNLSLLSSGFTQDMHDYANYMIANMEYNKLNTIIRVIGVLIHSDTLYKDLGMIPENNDALIAELLDGVVVERNPDLNILSQNLKDKLAVHESNILKYKEQFEKQQPESDEDYDIDEQLINVSLILEIPIPDESKMTLYQYSLMNKKAYEKAQHLEKLNSK
ncbi:hypothetical protein [uncultured Chryseobacterium sp.]|uniref:hypothetical protein n=1 Tax=uncultured Chryseobacterium sp. TaxID=259322 RepID=UPI0025CCD890|nr:hypothetical protein [uncultured Chryseobacterium sp.]